MYGLPLEAVYGLTSEGRPASPCAVKQAFGGRTFLPAVSLAARSKGVRPGMSLVEGRARLPTLEVRPEDPATEERLQKAAAEALFAFGPTVEIVPRTGCLVDIGLVENEGQVAQAILQTMSGLGHAVSLAIADDPETAQTLAQHAAAIYLVRSKGLKQPPDVLIAPRNGSAEALGPLPLEALLWTDPIDDPEGRLRMRLSNAHASFRVLGVRDTAHLATFPADQVASRFGDAGTLLMQRAQGTRARLLRPFTPPEQAIETFELDSATDAIEPVLFILKRLLDRLEVRLLARGRAMSALVLDFRLDAGRKNKRDRLRVALTRPTRSAHTLLTLCREKLGGALSGPVLEVRIEANGLVADRGAQLDLFTAQAQRVEKAEDLVARLQAALNENAIFAAEVQNRHRPEEAWQARPFEIMRAFGETAQSKPKPKPAAPWVAQGLSSKSREAFRLPEASQVSVTATMGNVAVATRPATQVATSWPKTIKRMPEDEPVQLLPPRPIELLAHPEPARIEGSALLWRGERLAIDDTSGRERFECEWWQRAPLDREYATLDLEDGRRLWMFYDTEQQPWIHGVFD